MRAFRCVYVIVFARRPIPGGVQLRAPQFQVSLIFGVWHTEGRNSFTFGQRQKSVLLVCDSPSGLQLKGTQ